MNNDGPAYYHESGTCRYLDVGGSSRIDGSNEDISNTPFSGSITSPYAQLHIEGGTVNRLQLSGGHHTSGGTDNSGFLSNHSGNLASVTITGGDAPSGEDWVGSNIEVLALASGPVNYNMDFNARAGVELSHEFGGTLEITDLKSGATTYIGNRGATPHSPNGSSDIYLDNGSNTSDGNPHWRYDDGGSWVDL